MMSIQKIELRKESNQNVERLFNLLSEHENMALLFHPARVARICSGLNCRNGIGSIRLVKIPLMPAIEETVTGFQQNEFIEYKVTNLTPLKNHVGTMRFYPRDGGSRLEYTIFFESRIPGAGPLIKTVLEAVIKRGLQSIT